MLAGATTTVAPIGEAPRCARLGRDNSVSAYRHNLLTATFYGASTAVAESEHANKTSYFKFLSEPLERKVPREFIAAA